MTTLAILLHELDTAFESTPYLLKPMLDLWRARGIEVASLRGPGPGRAADLLLPHLDLTVTPADYAARFDAYPRVVNRRVLDISKSSFSANLVCRDDAYDGPVIVKTEANYGGLPDKRLGARGRATPAARLARPLARLARKLAGGSPWRHLEWMAPDRYPIFDSPRQVPAAIFDNPSLVVEKFLAERDGDAYCVRYYYFLGDRETCLRLHARQPIAKGANIDRVEPCPVPEEVRVLRRRLGFDYGKFDFVMHAGRAEVFDINRTPAANVLRRFGLHDAVAAHLAGGIEALIEGERRP